MGIGQDRSGLLPPVFSTIGRPVFLTYEGLFVVRTGFFTYHGFQTITSSSNIISLD
jgi:hypothetical protein